MSGVSDKVEKVVVDDGFNRILDEGIKKNLKAIKRLAKK